MVSMVTMGKLATPINLGGPENSRLFITQKTSDAALWACDNSYERTRGVHSKYHEIKTVMVTWLPW